MVNLGETFDLVNIKYPATELAPAGTNARQLARNSLAGYNVTSIALEVPKACVTAGSDPVIGAWTTASLRQASVLNSQPQSAKSVASVGSVASPTGAAVQGGAWTQVSRLGMPLVNELIIGLPDKDRFNASSPSGDAQFADYVTNPSLPVLLQTLFGSAGVLAPNVYPRTDLEAAFLTGIKGLNQPLAIVPAEELRLNTSTAVTPIATQNDLGVLGGDPSGFPNGRRPIDDVVDIELRVAMGALLSPFDASPADPDPASESQNACVRDCRIVRRIGARRLPFSLHLNPSTVHRLLLAQKSSESSEPIAVNGGALTLNDTSETSTPIPVAAM